MHKPARVDAPLGKKNNPMVSQLFANLHGGFLLFLLLGWLLINFLSCRRRFTLPPLLLGFSQRCLIQLSWGCCSCWDVAVGSVYHLHSSLLGFLRLFGCLGLCAGRCGSNLGEYVVKAAAWWCKPDVCSDTKFLSAPEQLSARGQAHGSEIVAHRVSCLLAGARP